MHLDLNLSAFWYFDGLGLDLDFIILFYNNNNDILLQTRGLYHRHKSTKSG